MVRWQRTSEELHDLIVAEVRAQPGHADFDAAFTIEPLRDAMFTSHTWEPGPVAMPERHLTAFRQAVERIRRHNDLWPWPEPSAPAHGTTPSF